MSDNLDEIRTRIAALQGGAAEAAAADVVSLLAPRFRSGTAEARGDTVALIPGGRSDAWAADVTTQIAETTARIGAGK